MGVDFWVEQRGVEKITIGGIRSLLDFSPEEVTLAIRNGSVRVQGENLEILYFNSDEISLAGKVTGTITEVTRSPRLRKGR